jgi:hypothetical protein
MKTLEKLLSAPKGSFQSVTWQSSPKPAEAHKGIKLEKITSAVCKAGIDFSNLSTVKQGIESGERGEVQALPWGQWDKFPFTITHKGETYVRLYPAAQANQVKTLYKVDGQEVNKEVFNTYLTPSDAKKTGEKPECFTVKACNLID